MDKDRLNSAFEALTPNETASRRMLKNIHSHNAEPKSGRYTGTVHRSGPDTRSGFSPARFAAVTFALCMCAVMGYFTWQYIAGLGEPQPGGLPAGPGITAGAIHTEFVPYDIALPPIEYAVFTWGPSVISYVPTSPVIIESVEELEAFSWQTGYFPRLSSVSPSNLPIMDLDYSQKVVVAVWHNKAVPAGYEYGAPIVSWGGPSIYVTPRLVPAEAPTLEAKWMGYFLIIDRELLGMVHQTREEEYASNPNVNLPPLIEFASQGIPDKVPDLTPDELRGTGIRVYGSMLARPGMALEPLGGWYESDVYASADASYIIYTIGFGSGIHRSHVVIKFLDGSNRFWQTAWYFHRDMELEPLGGGKWAVYHMEPFYLRDPSESGSDKGKLLAVLTVAEEGVWVDVMDEDGMELLPSYWEEGQPEATEPSASPPEGDLREPLPYEVGTVRIISNGKEYDPLVNWIYSLQGGLSGDGASMQIIDGELIPWSHYNVTGELASVLYSDDFRAVIDGEDAGEPVYYLFDDKGEYTAGARCLFRPMKTATIF
jgi:hypothetical protein